MTLNGIAQWYNYVLVGLLGLLWYDIRHLKSTYITREEHERECDLKLGPMKDNIVEIKKDVKVLLKRSGEVK